MVKISPKDMGPIDTHSHTKCNECGKTVAMSGKKCYDGSKSKGRRKTKSWHTTHYNVCPHCKGAPNHHNVDTVKHHNCGSYASAIELINVSWNSKPTKCPVCNEKVTQENSTVVE